LSSAGELETAPTNGMKGTSPLAPAQPVPIRWVSENPRILDAEYS
jgi:hypothetical protein